MKKLLCSLLAVLLISGLARAVELKGKVIAVIDGNTFQIAENENETRNVVLYGIDCPEIGQAFGPEAKICLEKLLLGKDVTITLMGKDRFGNTLAEVLVNGKKDVRIQLLKEGLAWTAEHNPLADLETYRASAQQQSKGLWKHDSPTPPWIYRREQAMVAKGS